MTVISREELETLHPLTPDPQREKLTFSHPVASVWEDLKKEDTMRYVKRKKELYYEKRLSY